MSKEFREPILSTIYRVVGVIVAAIGTLAAIASILGSAIGGAPGGLVGGLGVLVTTAVIALPFFGIAQIFEYMGKTAYYAESINNGLLTSLHEINKTAQQMSSQLKSAQSSATPADVGASPERVANCPHCGASIPVRQLHKGTNTCPLCAQVFDVE